MRQQMPNVHSRFGAPMGRDEWHDEPPAMPCRCFRLRMVDGDYDDGGAYWGGGGPGGSVYCATDDDGFRLFTRAKSRADAKARFVEREPRIRWRN